MSSQRVWGGCRGETEGRAYQLGHSRLPLVCPGPFLPGSHVFFLIANICLCGWACSVDTGWRSVTISKYLANT